MKFWLVWNIYRGLPAKQHLSFLEATSEALRLAKKEPGDFYVLEAVEVVHSTVPALINIVTRESLKEEAE